MKVLTYPQKCETPLVLALGFFDCMHFGHARLLKKAKELADERHCSFAVFTFENNHFKVLGIDTKLLYTFSERLTLFDSFSADVVVKAKFDEKFKNTSGDEFLNSLCENYSLQAVVFGFDYTCGSDRKNSTEISKYFASKDVACYVVDEVCCDGKKISSSSIRRLIENNEIEKANSLLSQPFFITGEVVHGRHEGTKIGFPTANLAVDADKLLPVGVFSGKTVLDGKEYGVIVNVGAQPTFGGDKTVVEAHVDGFCGDLYGKNMKISLNEYIRPIKKFAGEKDLVEQLNADLARIKQ